MKKRLLSLALVFVLMLSIIPVQTIAESGTPAADASTPGATVELQTDHCIYCEETTAEDGTVTHAEGCNTLYAVDASGDVGKTFGLNYNYYIAYTYSAKPTEGFDYDEGIGDNSDGDAADFIDFEYDWNDPPIVKIADWCWEVSGTALWYQVEALDGETLPDGLAANTWVLVNYTHPNLAGDDYLVPVDASVIGKIAEFDAETPVLYDAIWGETVEADVSVLAKFVITDVYSDGTDAVYYVDAAEGETWPEEYANYHYVDAAQIALDTCDLCGDYDCTALHFYCEICKEYNCDEDHLYCNACKIFDCDKTHTWCGYCGTYECGKTHEPLPSPDTDPVIPENPTLTEGADVSIVDSNGDPVTEDGFRIEAGRKTSLSAWLEQEENVSYRWQICYDLVNDLWTEIRGQDEQGILLSPAMIQSMIQYQGRALIRCAVINANGVRTSAAIPVSVASQAYSQASGSSIVPQAEDDGDALQEAYVVVQYVYSDGRTAASTEFAEIIPGTAYSHDYTLPKIPGYKAVLNSHSFGNRVAISGDKLSVNFAAGELTNDYTIFTVTYEPDYVRYTVIHYWQNVDNDNYTEHERETNTATHKTGDVIADAHNSYPGFYNLLYETPAAAADGSTVIEVYYDRYYYLMKFEMDGGYGMDPVYARYDSDVEVQEPQKAGYYFGGWVDADGNEITVPNKVPENGGTYYAKWYSEQTDYAVAYWILDEQGNKTYIGSKIVEAESGSTVSGSDDLSVNTNTCGVPEHAHDSCTMTCPLSEHTHGDGNCVYDCGEIFHDHTSNCVYTACGKEEHTTHTRSCYNFTSATVSDTAANVDVDYYSTINGFPVYRTSSWSNRRYYVLIGDSYYQISNYGYSISLAHTVTCHQHVATCCSVAYHDHADCSCIVTPHIHGTSCYDCEALEHTHTDACKSDLAKYVSFIRADQSVTVEGDGSTVVNTYYEYKTYTIRFIYARKNGTRYDVATLTRDGRLDNCQWSSVSSSLPTFSDPSGKTERSEVVIDGDTYYYISLTAKFGADISKIWPSANIGNAGSYVWGSWAAAAGTGYRETYGDSHANIVGPYPVMSADMIVDDPELLADGTYLAQNMIAWWGSDSGWSPANIAPHAYHNYFELLPGESTADAVLYNGKYYKLVETYTFTAAHNGDTRVDPIFFNGYTCINDSRKTNNDTQANSKNFANNGNCDICGSACDYCNTFYYDRNMHKLYFWNHNGYLQEGTGSDVMFGTSLVNHGKYVEEEFMNQPENYPEGLEPNAYKFGGWYTTADCHEGTQMDWTTTMPDSDMTVYAKWEPVSHTVTYYLTEDSLKRGEDIPTEMERLVDEAGSNLSIEPYTAAFSPDYLLHGTFIENLSDPKVTAGFENIHPRAGYDFIGWFYRNEAGEEVAFDPMNMPVRRALNLYGKWSANVLCYYNVYFALDENGDGIADTDASGNIIYVADPINGSAIAGRTYTFAAKGGEELYDPEGETNYREGYFPTVGSHSITIDIKDVDGTDTNCYTFLYKPKATVPYTVQYVDKATGEELIDAKVVSDNKNVVVTENFVYIPKYMPDEYQKTLVVTDDGNAGNDVIIFYYTKDEEHALYVVNYYIQQLNSDLSHAGWIKYTDLQYTGNIGTSYSANAINIDGFSLSESFTNDYNTLKKINGMTGIALPSEVQTLSGTQLEGTLTAAGMELNFYYTRDLYPFEFRFMLNGTTVELAEPVVGKAGYDMIVTQTYKEIVMDLDGDGINEDYRLYDPTQTVKEIHINKDGSPLDPNAIVTEGQATVNIATFYYVRCTQTMTVTKQVTDNSAESDPDPDQVFQFSLLIHAKDGYHQTSYDYKLSDGSAGTLAPVVTKPNTLEFTLKAGQTITIEGLPTAEYTLTELDLPAGYYDDTYAPAQRNKLTVEGQLDVIVSNVYEPARLEISKRVDVVEGDTNTPEVTEFEYTITVPNGVTGTYSYKLGNTVKTATVTDGKLTVSVKNGETVRFLNLPLGSYTVAEKDYSAYGYDSNYSVNGAAYTEGTTATVALTRKSLHTVDYLNKFPVGDLIIDKTVTKEFYRSAWNGDTFTFTVERTTAGRPLITGNSYKLVLDGVEQAAVATVDANGKLTVTITFTAADAETLKIEDSAVQHLLTVKNLPAGTYKVTESKADGYEQTPAGLTVEGLTIPAENTTASFRNEVLRKYGDLYLEKKMEVLQGFNPPDEVIRFRFIVELLEGVPTNDMTFTVTYTSGTYTNGDATPITATMSGGKLIVTLEKNQSVKIENLPEGKYRITEETAPYYANDFAHKVNGAWVPQPDQSTEAGQMFTEIDVPADGLAEVLCTNTYPVDRAELVLQKLVTKEYDRDVLPNTEFLFTVTLAEPDMDSYNYKVYNADGSVATEGTLAAADKKVFTVTLKAGQYAVIPGMPVCGYTVVETVSTTHYTPGYAVYVSDTGDEISTTVNTDTVSDSGSGAAVSRTFSAGKTDALVFTNEYKRHLGTLTIHKTVEGTDAKDTFLFHISGNGVEMDVTIDGSGSVTIHDLPLGTYTVTEDTSWSWRYTTTSATAGAALTLDDLHAEVSFTNTYKENRWLNFFANMFNIFGKKTND